MTMVLGPRTATGARLTYHARGGALRDVGQPASTPVTHPRVVPRDDGTNVDLLQVDRQDHRRRQRDTPHRDQAVHTATPQSSDAPAIARHAMTSTLRTQELTKSYGGRTVVRGVSIEVGSGEIVGLLGAERRGQDHDVLHDRRADRSGFRSRAARRRGRDRRADVRARAEGDRVPAAGAVDLSRADRRAEHHGDPRDARARSRRRGEQRLQELLAELQPDAARDGAGAHVVGRRAASGGDHARAGDVAAVHPAGRAVCRHRSDCGHATSRRSCFT